MKTTLQVLPFWFFSIGLLFSNCQSGPVEQAAMATPAFTAATAPVPTVNLRDSAAFFSALKQAFQQKDARLLSELIAETVRSGYLNEAQGCVRGCPKSELIKAAFNGPEAEGWKKFDVVWRVGFGSMYSEQFRASHGDSNELEYFLGPAFPGLDGNPEQLQKAYIFADKAHVRNEPDKNSASLTQVSRCWMTVDTDALCYGDVPEDWLPVLLVDGRQGFVYIHLTSWSRNNGFMLVRKDATGKFEIVEMNWFDALPGTWYLPGCC